MRNGRLTLRAPAAAPRGDWPSPELAELARDFRRSGVGQEADPEIPPVLADVLAVIAGRPPLTRAELHLLQTWERVRRWGAFHPELAAERPPAPHPAAVRAVGYDPMDLGDEEDR
jgi:hypothetical protein